jgi:hypothetical protein
MIAYRVEREHVSRLGSAAWLFWAGPFRTRAEAEREVMLAMSGGGRRLRIVRVECEGGCG